MSEETSRTIITDQLWPALEKALGQAKRSNAGTPPEQGDREFIEAVLWIARTGSPWRDMPLEVGKWHSVYVRFRRWDDRAVWQKLWTLLQTDEFAQARHLFVDSTTVRAHQHAAGAPKKKGLDQALGRSRGGLTTKIHAACLDENFCSALLLTGGNESDCGSFEALYESLPEENVIEVAALDKGYDSNAIRERFALDGVEAVIPPKSNRKEAIPCDMDLYKQRNRVERFFNKLKQFRRVATRYEKLKRCFFAMVCLAASFIALRNS